MTMQEFDNLALEVQDGVAAHIGRKRIELTIAERIGASEAAEVIGDLRRLRAAIGRAMLGEGCKGCAVSIDGVEKPDNDPLRAFKGILTAAGISLGLWVVVIGAAVLIVHTCH